MSSAHPPVTALGIDPGSAHCGVVVGSIAEGALGIRSADVIPVAPANLDATVDACAAVADTGGCAEVVIEFGPWYPSGKTPQALLASHAAWVVCNDLVRLLGERFATLGIPVVIVNRQAAAHRVVPHHQGGVDDANVLAALPNWLDAASLAHITDPHRRGNKHMRDAAVALLWRALPVPRSKRGSKRYRDRRHNKSKPRLAAASLLTVAERRARRDGYARLAARAARVLSRLLTPEAPIRGAYRCQRCGSPKQGHARGLTACPPPGAPSSTPAPRSPSRADRLRAAVNSGLSLPAAAAAVDLPYLTALRLL